MVWPAVDEVFEGGETSSVLATLDDVLPIPILVFDAAGVLVAASIAAKRVLPARFREGARVGQVFPYTKELEAAMKEALAGTSTRLEGLRLSTETGPVLAAVGFHPVAGISGQPLVLAVVEALHEHKAGHLYEAFFEHAVDLMCIANREGYFEELSPSWEDLLGWSLDELRSRPYVKFVHPADRIATKREAQRVAAEGVMQAFENRFRRRDGTYVWLQWSAYAPPGEPIYATARDITEVKKSTHDWREAYHALKENEKERLQFFQQATHDLAAPFDSITMQVHLHKKKGALDHDIMDRQIKHMRTLIRDLQDVGTMASTRLRLSLRPIQLDDIVASAVRSMRDVAVEEGIKLDCLLEEAPVDADATRLNQVLYNLISNAIKFTPRGGNIRVSIELHGKDAVVVVQDSGRGLTPKEQQKVFKPFSQARRPGEEHARGMGLGLAICKGIVEAHGGEITVRSAGHGKGCTFSFTLPMASSSART